MGNRANVIFTNKKRNSFSPTIYLHWNGGPESIYGFLEELDRRKVRADQEYEAARFTQIVGEYMDQTSQGGYSLGILSGPKNAKPEQLLRACDDTSDNGLYLICREGGEIRVERIFEGPNVKSEIWVKEEKAEAYKSAYLEEFRKFFSRLANNREVQE